MRVSHRYRVAHSGLRRTAISYRNCETTVWAPKCRYTHVNASTLGSLQLLRLESHALDLGLQARRHNFPLFATQTPPSQQHSNLRSSPSSTDPTATITDNNTICRIMENSPFAKLPAELRNNVWELALRADKPVQITGDFHIVLPPVDCKLAPSQVQEMAKILALTQTCRQIHSECALLFFHFNTFEFDSTCTTFPGSSFPDFRRKIGKASFSAISSANITTRIRFSHVSKWSFQFCNKTSQAVDCVKALAQPVINTRPEFEFSPPYICPRIMISLQEWDTSWKAAAETIEEAARTTRDPRRKDLLARLLKHLPTHKQYLKELLGIWNMIRFEGKLVLITLFLDSLQFRMLTCHRLVLQGLPLKPLIVGF